MIHYLHAKTVTNIKKTENCDGFLTILNYCELSVHLNKFVTNEKVLFFKLIESPVAVISYSVVINAMFMYVIKSFQTELKTPFLSNNIHEIKHLLSEIDKCDQLGKLNLNENNHIRTAKAINVVQSEISIL